MRAGLSFLPAAPLLLAGCFDLEGELILNPDTSGTLLVTLGLDEWMVKEKDLQGDWPTALSGLRSRHPDIVWSKVEVARREGRVTFKVAGYFDKIERLTDQGLDFKLNRTEDGGLELSAPPPKGIGAEAPLPAELDLLAKLPWQFSLRITMPGKIVESAGWTSVDGRQASLKINNKNFRAEMARLKDAAVRVRCGPPEPDVRQQIETWARLREQARHENGGGLSVDSEVRKLQDAVEGLRARVSDPELQARLDTIQTELEKIRKKISSPAPSLSGAPISGTEVRLRWTDPYEDETAWVVERRAPAPHAPAGKEAGRPFSRDWEPVASLPANTVEWTDSGLFAGVELEYRVRARRGTCWAPYSGALALRTKD